MTPAGMTTAEMLDDRYGRRRSPRARALLFAVAAVAAIAVAALGWSIVAATFESVDSDTTGYEIADEHTLVLDFQFSGPTGRSIACALEAQDGEHGTVGWVVVEYPPSDQHARAFTERIPTLAAATTGLVNSCWVT